MATQQPSGRARLGFLLALTTASLWGTLPIALKVALERVDAFTVTWFRFTVAFLVLGSWFVARDGVASFVRLAIRDGYWLGLAAVMLISNYVLYVLGLHRTTPANAQLLVQLAPLLMTVGGIVVFGERFSAGQWVGAAVVVLGMVLFFADQSLRAEADLGNYAIGSLCVVVSAVVWAVYALVQKRLIGRLAPSAVLVFIYATASVVLLPVATPQPLAQLDVVHAVALGYCALNTLVSYGAFAEALRHWEASRVGLVLAITPLLTVAAALAAHRLGPSLFPAPDLGPMAALGAAVTVLGSCTTTWFAPRTAKKT